MIPHLTALCLSANLSNLIDSLRDCSDALRNDDAPRLHQALDTMAREIALAREIAPRLTCAHCGHRDTPEEPVILVTERLTDETTRTVAQCADIVRCWHRLGGERARGEVSHD